jgi:hypothetical protein
MKGDGEEDQVRFLWSSCCDSDFDTNLYFGGLTSLSHRLLPGPLIDEQLKAWMVQFQQKAEPEYLEVLESLAAAYVGSSMLNRRLFITEEGRIGTAANKAEIGDKVCVIFGCAYLVVLQAKDDEYVMVGDVYIDGLGVVEVERELEGEKYEVEKFNIR